MAVTSEPPSTHESCLPHFRDDCNRHLLFGCLSAAASALSNAFVLIQVNRFQQVIGVFTLQAPTEVAKVSDDKSTKLGIVVCGYELPTNLKNFMQKDLTEVEIFQKVFWGLLFLKHPVQRRHMYKAKPIATISIQH